MTLFHHDDAASREEGTAVALAGLRRGDVVGLHADSSYALAADAFSSRGVLTVQELKGRGDFATAILIGREMAVDGIVENVTEDMRKLMAAFWPGGLTFLARPQRTLAWAANRDSISVRLPSNEWTREIAAEIGPMVAVAASRGAHKAPTTATQAAEIWGSDVPHWLDAGMADFEKKSTVVDCRGDRLNIVRLGCLSASNLRQVVPGITMIAS